MIFRNRLASICYVEHNPIEKQSLKEIKYELSSAHFPNIEFWVYNHQQRFEVLLRTLPERNVFKQERKGIRKQFKQNWAVSRVQNWDDNEWRPIVRVYTVYIIYYVGLKYICTQVSHSTNSVQMRMEIDMT